MRLLREGLAHVNGAVVELRARSGLIDAVALGIVRVAVSALELAVAELMPGIDASRAPQ